MIVLSPAMYEQGCLTKPINNMFVNNSSRDHKTVKTYPVPLTVQDSPGLQQEHLVDILLAHRGPKVSGVGVHLFAPNVSTGISSTRQSRGWLVLAIVKKRIFERGLRMFEL